MGLETFPGVGDHLAALDTDARADALCLGRYDSAGTGRLRTGAALLFDKFGLARHPLSPAAWRAARYFREHLMVEVRPPDDAQRWLTLGAALALYNHFFLLYEFTQAERQAAETALKECKDYPDAAKQIGLTKRYDWPMLDATLRRMIEGRPDIASGKDRIGFVLMVIDAALVERRK